MSETATTAKPAAQAKATTVETLLLHHDVSQFLFEEARLQDEHCYSDWESLWTDDGIYWVPANGDDTVDPDTDMSIIYDNRSRIGLRIRQFYTGRRYAQEPKSRLNRTLSNIVVKELENGELAVSANAVMLEISVRGETIWSCRYKYLLRRDGNSFKMARKTVLLPNNDRAIYSMAFLI